MASRKGTTPRIPRAARMPIRVVLVDDDEPFLRAANELLAQASDIACVGLLNCGNEAQQAVANLKPDVAILGTSTAGITGLSLARELELSMPSLRIVMVAAPVDDCMIFEAMTAGVTGFLIKPILLGELERAIRVAHSGGVPLCPRTARAIVNVLQTSIQRTVSLSYRQREVMRCVLKGELEKEIAAHLGLSPDTVHTHMKQIYRILGVHSRAEAARIYLGLGL